MIIRKEMFLKMTKNVTMISAWFITMSHFGLEYSSKMLCSTYFFSNSCNSFHFLLNSRLFFHFAIFLVVDFSLTYYFGILLFQNDPYYMTCTLPIFDASMCRYIYKQLIFDTQKIQALMILPYNIN